MIRIKPMTEATDVEPIEEPMMPMMEEAIPAEEPVMSREGYVDQMAARYFGPEAMCQGCIHFLEPDACDVVAGPIDPEGICSLFTADEGAYPEEVDVAELVEEPIEEPV